ncbi:peptidoglycan amidohydrolase family protein, partial [Streptococcus agalactiae]
MIGHGNPLAFALRSAGASDNGWAVNTEYEHDWLIKNGYV